MNNRYRQVPGIVIPMNTGLTTDFAPTTNSVIDAVYEVLDMRCRVSGISSGQSCFRALFSSGTAHYFGADLYSSNRVIYAYNADSMWYDALYHSPGRPMLVHFPFSGNTLLLNGVGYGRFGMYVQALTDNPIVIGTVVRSGLCSTTDAMDYVVYRFRISEGSSVVRDYVPVFDTETHRYTLYDLITDSVTTEINHPPATINHVGPFEEFGTSEVYWSSVLLGSSGYAGTSTNYDSTNYYSRFGEIAILSPDNQEDNICGATLTGVNISSNRDVANCHDGRRASFTMSSCGAFSVTAQFASPIRIKDIEVQPGIEDYTVSDSGSMVLRHLIVTGVDQYGNSGALWQSRNAKLGSLSNLENSEADVYGPQVGNSLCVLRPNAMSSAYRASWTRTVLTAQSGTLAISNLPCALTSQGGSLLLYIRLYTASSGVRDISSAISTPVSWRLLHATYQDSGANTIVSGSYLIQNVDTFTASLEAITLSNIAESAAITCTMLALPEEWQFLDTSNVVTSTVCTSGNVTIPANTNAVAVFSSTQATIVRDGNYTNIQRLDSLDRSVLAGYNCPSHRYGLTGRTSPNALDVIKSGAQEHTYLMWQRSANSTASPSGDIVFYCLLFSSSSGSGAPEIWETTTWEECSGVVWSKFEYKTNWAVKRKTYAYLLTTETAVYTIEDSVLTLVGEMPVRANTFHMYGLDTLPDDTMLKSAVDELGNIPTKLVAWSNTACRALTCTLGISVPYELITTQSLNIPNNAHLTNCFTTFTGSPKVAFQFNDGDWEYISNGEWVVCDAESDGTPVDTVNDIDSTIWDLRITTCQTVKIRAIITQDDSISRFSLRFT